MRLHRLTSEQFVQFCRQLLALDGYKVEVQEESLSGTVVVSDGTRKRVLFAPYHPLGPVEPSLDEIVPPIEHDEPVLLLHNFWRPLVAAEDPRVEELGLSALTTKAVAHGGLLESFATPRALCVRSIELENFRGFEKIELRLGESTTVLIGVNGSGKSSVLDALAMSLSWFTQRVIHNYVGNGRKPTDQDIRNGARGVGIRIVCDYWGEPVEWSLVASKRGQPAKERSDLKAIRHMIDDLYEDLSMGGESANVPVAVSYPVNRAVLDIPRRIRKKHLFGPLETYEEALTGGSDFRVFFEWFREREDYENEQRVNADARFRDPELEAVRLAISSLMSGYGGLRVQRRPQRIVLTKGSQELLVEQLSDGEKCLLALTGDLARRLALANLGAQKPLEGSGIVLIDEVELHLHPAWQRQVIPALMRTFPNCQFVVTTHSPLVLSGVDRSSVRILKDFRIAEQSPPVEGRDANAILSELMGLPAFPEKTQKKLRVIDELIQAEKFDQARREVEELAETMGEHDPEVVHQRSALEFLAAGIWDN